MDKGQVVKISKDKNGIVSVVKLFKEKLGYTYLGNWKDRPNNSNIEEALLTSYLSKKGYNPTLIKGNRGETEGSRLHSSLLSRMKT
ncbi:MAG: hypothetical protein JRE64_13215 [Deltaproteobacteria bacterium]|nr:hypothetical protein [Deltaproteobacteria bacterium]